MQPTLFPLTPNNSKPRQITSSLKEKAILVDFDGGFYNWRRRDQRVESAVASANNVSKSAGTYLKNLFLGADAALAAIRTVVQNARHDNDNMTLPWAPGRRLLLNQNVLTYKQRQMEHAIQLDAQKDALSAAYSRILSTVSRTLGSLYNPDEYPALSEILDAAYIRHKFYPIADASDVRLSCDSELVASIQQEVRAEADATYKAAVLSTWERLIEVMKSATTNLSKGVTGAPGQRYRSEWHQHLTDLVPLLAGLNLDDDPRLAEMARRCTTILRPDPEEYEVSLDARARAYSSAQSIYDDMCSIFGQKGGQL